MRHFASKEKAYQPGFRIDTQWPSSRRTTPAQRRCDDDAGARGSEPGRAS